MPNPYFITQLLEQLLEPGRIATAFKTHHHLLSARLLVKLPHFSRLLVVQLQPFYLSIFSCQIAERLLARMKVDPDIYCHRRLLLLTQIVSTVSLTTNGRRRLLHNIRPDLRLNMFDAYLVSNLRSGRTSQVKRSSHAQTNSVCAVFDLDFLESRNSDR